MAGSAYTTSPSSCLIELRWAVLRHTCSVWDSDRAWPTTPSAKRCTLNDPDGLGIEVYADRPHGSWTYRGDELVMTTEPLDIGGLITAGEGNDWDGAPDGTTMGHVHLHVGDLARADAFYHRALGFDKTVWSYPGALFFSAGGYHHHLGTNIWSPGPSARADEARLLEWELVVPERGQTDDVAERLRTGGYVVDDCTRRRADVRPVGNAGVYQSEESR